MKINRRIVLNVLSLTGLVATPILAISGTIKAVDKINNINQETLTKKEIVKAALPCYIPTIATMLATGACIVINDRMNRHDYLTLSTLYGITNKSLQEYKTKLIEVDENTIEIKREDDHEDKEYLMYDVKSDRYFRMHLDTIFDAMDKVYANLEHGEFVSLNRFYEMLGLAPTFLGRDTGWYQGDDYKLLDMTLTTYNGQECMMIDVDVDAKNTY